jgi:hypothetical protein
MNRRSSRYQIIVTTKVWADEVFADVVEAKSRKVDAIKRAKQLTTSWGKDVVKVQVKDTFYGIIDPIIWSWSDAAHDARIATLTELTSIGRYNAVAATDEIGTYDDSREAAIDAYHVNLIDTLIERGHRDDAEAFHVAETAFWKHMKSIGWIA